MTTASNPTEGDTRPADQREGAAHAHPNRHEPALEAEAGTPQYGDFGKPGETESPAPRDGSNDNPDEFSEFGKQEDRIPRDGTTNSPNSNPQHQTGHVVQNRDPQAVKEAQGDVQGRDQQEEDNTRTAWAQDDERYAGGHAEASWQDQNDKEHDNS